MYSQRLTIDGIFLLDSKMNNVAAVLSLRLSKYCLNQTYISCKLNVECVTSISSAAVVFFLQVMQMSRLRGLSFFLTSKRKPSSRVRHPTFVNRRAESERKSALRMHKNTGTVWGTQKKISTERETRWEILAKKIIELFSVPISLPFFVIQCGNRNPWVNIYWMFSLSAKLLFCLQLICMDFNDKI